MKKLILSTALVVGLGFSQIRAQEVSGGIKLDANMSNFILSDMPGTKSKMGVGLSIGGFAKMEFSENFGLQPELLLHWKNSKMETNSISAFGGDMDLQYFGLELPVYAVGYMNAGGGKCFLGAGPYLGFGIDARYKASGIDDIDLYKEYGGQKSGMQRWDFGGGAMLGYEIANKFQIAATYKIGFINALNAGKDDATMLNQAISIGCGYRF